MLSGSGGIFWKNANKKGAKWPLFRNKFCSLLNEKRRVTD